MKEVSLFIRVKSFCRCWLLDFLRHKWLFVVIVIRLRTTTTPISLTLHVRRTLNLQIGSWLTSQDAPDLGNNEVHPEDVHQAGDCDRHKHHHEHDHFQNVKVFLTKQIVQFGIPIAEKNEDLENKTAE